MRQTTSGPIPTVSAAHHRVHPCTELSKCRTRRCCSACELTDYFQIDIIDSKLMSALPDELWRKILEMGIRACSFTYMDLCCIGISCRRLSRLSDEDEFWSVFLSRDFPQTTSANSSLTSKSLYRVRFEKDKERNLAAHRRAVLRTESLVWDSERKIKELESKIGDEVEKMKAASLELSNLRKVSQASSALNVWQPETVRRWQKLTVEQCVVSVESRVSALEMEVKLCKQQISVYDKAHKSAKQRLQIMKQRLASMKYHPFKDYNSAATSHMLLECNTNRKKLKTKISDDKEEKPSSS